MSTHLMVIIMLVLGLPAGLLVAYYAAKRTTKQPVPVEIESEKKTIQSVLKDPSGYVFVAELEPEAFVKAEHLKLWGAIKDAFKDVSVPSPEAKEAEFEKAAQAVPGDLLERLSASPVLTEEDHTFLTSLLKENVSTSRKDLLKRGSDVYNAANDRGRFAGAAPLSQGGDGEDLLVRRFHAPSRGRQVFSALLLGGVGALAPWIADVYFSAGSFSWYLAIAAIFVLGAFSLTWALVDLDTLYLDYPSFFLGGGVAWALTAAAVWSAGDLGRLWPALWTVLGVALVFEGGSFLFKLIRGEAGMGFGDTVIAVATVGIPVALTGSWAVGYYTLIASGVVAIIGWLILRARGKVQSDTPFAFGPYLALGWIVALVLMTYIGIDTLEFI